MRIFLYIAAVNGIVVRTSLRLQVVRILTVEVIEQY